MKTILDHKMVKIMEDAGSYRVLITMSDGGVVEHEPFPGDQRGLVAAMSLATDVLAGKVWLKGLMSTANAPWTAPTSVMLESSPSRGRNT